tara:strand:+ start:15615 stop:15974 length:360 start_codon:yes stop_codon:yes gene_type:complete
MKIFNSDLPKLVDMQLKKGDIFTFLNNEIIIWTNKALEEGFDLSDYDGVLSLSFENGGVVQNEITTISGDMVFTSNIITFNSVPLDLRVKSYFYRLVLTNKNDAALIGTLLTGNFNVLK